MECSEGYGLQASVDGLDAVECAICDLSRGVTSAAGSMDCDLCFDGHYRNQLGACSPCPEDASCDDLGLFEEFDDADAVVRVGVFAPLAESADGSVFAGGVLRHVSAAAEMAARLFNARDPSVLAVFGRLGTCGAKLSVTHHNTHTTTVEARAGAGGPGCHAPSTRAGPLGDRRESPSDDRPRAAEASRDERRASSLSQGLRASLRPARCGPNHGSGPPGERRWVTLDREGRLASFLGEVVRSRGQVEAIARYREAISYLDAIVGPAFSRSASPVSINAAVDEVPVVSYLATSTELDDKNSHPFFTRVIPSDAAVRRGRVRGWNRSEAGPPSRGADPGAVRTL